MRDTGSTVKWLGGFVGATLGGYVGWYLGEKAGFMTAFMLSIYQLQALVMCGWCNLAAAL